MAHCSDEQMRQLAEACDVATFGVNNQDVHDESYRKAGKLDSTNFALKLDLAGSGLLDVIRGDLLEGHGETKSIRAELYKLNVYGKDSFFKSHKDTPRSGSMFGSLVLVYPTAHQGGTLVLRHNNKEWTFDSARMVSAEQDPCVAYIAFYSDVDHEVTLVTSGYRVTVTYNLYFFEDPAPLPSTIISHDAGEESLQATLRRLLDDVSFLPGGGYLGFGLIHQYPIDLEHIGWLRKEEEKLAAMRAIEGRLKGSDAILMKICKQLSLSVSLKFVIEDDSVYQPPPRTPVYVLFDHAIDLSGETVVDQELYQRLRRYNGGQLATRFATERVDEVEPDIDVHWVTQLPKANRVAAPYPAYGNEPSLGQAYAHFCVLVAVGPVGDRENGESLH